MCAIPKLKRAHACSDNADKVAVTSPLPLAAPPVCVCGDWGVDSNAGNETRTAISAMSAPLGRDEGYVGPVLREVLPNL